MKVTICIGSACHLQGSRYVVERIKTLVEENGLEDKVELEGVFCMHKCGGKGVSVTVDGVYHSLCADDVDEFFKEKIVACL